MERPGRLVWGFSVMVFAIISIIPFTSVRAGEIPSYNGNIGFEKAEDGHLFNQFMMNHKGKVVHVSVFLGAAQRTDFEEGYKKPDEFNRIYFFVKGHETGNEYLIHLPAKAKTKDYKFEYSQDNGHLSGYFKIYDINGPHMEGTMSVNLRPVDPPKK